MISQKKDCKRKRKVVYFSIFWGGRVQKGGLIKAWGQDSWAGRAAYILVFLTALSSCFLNKRAHIFILP